MTGIVNSTGARSGIIGTTVAPAIGTGTDGYVLTATVWQSEAAAAGGKIKNHWYNTTTRTSTGVYTLTTTWAEITYGSNEFKITGMTATENNILNISVNVGGIKQADVDGYRSNFGFKVDTGNHFCGSIASNQTLTFMVPGYWSMNFVVPASFTSKTIAAYAELQTGSTGVTTCTTLSGDMDHTNYTIGINVFEIEV